MLTRLYKADDAFGPISLIDPSRIGDRIADHAKRQILRFQQHRNRAAADIKNALTHGVKTVTLYFYAHQSGLNKMFLFLKKRVGAVAPVVRLELMLRIMKFHVRG